MGDGGVFVISLDFELLWGVRDKRTSPTMAPISSASAAPSRPCSICSTSGRSPATWATVGFLFCADKDELIESLPAQRPAYRDRRLSPYDDLDHARPRRRQRSLSITGCRCCADRGAAGATRSARTRFRISIAWRRGAIPPAFRADLAAAQPAAARRGIRLTSIVFPRNQMRRSICGFAARWGFRPFVATSRPGFIRAPATASKGRCGRGSPRRQLSADRGRRRCASPVMTEGLVDIASSRFLRPAGVRFERLRL